MADSDPGPSPPILEQDQAPTPETPPTRAPHDPVVAAKAAARPQLRPGSSMNGPLYMQTPSSNVVLVRKLKRKDRSTGKLLAQWFVENQIGLSLNLLALLFLAHFFIPKARPYTYKFFHLSYYNDDTGRYAIGFDDAYVLALSIVAFTGLRAWTMEYVLAPFAKFQGITKRFCVTRFSEQSWLLVYYSFFWPLGVYMYCRSPYYFNMDGLWTNWPEREIDGLMKIYILAQWGFWLQQFVVIHIEERRKDHWQMLSHHVITSSLIWACYHYHHTRVGHLILVLMDVVDIFLPLAKCLKYAGYTTLCDIAFVFFVSSWLMARHVLYIAVLWSIYADTPRVMDFGCYRGTNAGLEGPFERPAGLTALVEPFYKFDGTVCFDHGVKWMFLVPLIFLQIITLFWFSLIVRVVIKVLRGGSAEDSRSDDEGEEDEEEDEFVYEEAEPLEEHVGVESLDLKGWERRHGVKIQSSSSGVSLPGHSDRKELLGRIGCEKQVD
ncbi:Acyl-CoA-dependent ceramide synthase [Geosmithia morbida]|uniref:Acyl-CoA-dependent ceramide synthase n=1 Tax=Geosmithia morbida TaxID=1094350 RepID=A0A9P4YWH7_9HYPO|nr:Acyl-CoA-dependent ceramide synthase [Geosmithia morbida]KAF4124388.1 Acyl-CoA-dependent ceramide synthase [Geosmithia morbida]